MGVPQNGGFIRENPAKIDEQGYSQLWKAPCLFCGLTLSRTAGFGLGNSSIDFQRVPWGHTT